MNGFFKKTMLGRSNTTTNDQIPSKRQSSSSSSSLRSHRYRNFPSPRGLLSLVISSPPQSSHILSSVSVRLINSGDREKRFDFCKDQSDDTSFSEWSESDDHDQTAVESSSSSSWRSSSPLRSRSNSRTKPFFHWSRSRENLPPFLTTMDGSGRPRFELRKVRCEGRLVILMAENERPRAVVRSPRDDTDKAVTRLVVPQD